MDKARPCGSGAPGSEGQQLRSAGRPGPSRGSVSPKAPPVGDQTAVIKNVDMSEEVQQHAVECAIVAIEKYNVEREIAALIKREFEKKHSPARHCIVGRWQQCVS